MPRRVNTSSISVAGSQAIHDRACSRDAFPGRGGEGDDERAVRDAVQFFQGECVTIEMQHGKECRIQRL